MSSSSQQYQLVETLLQEKLDHQITQCHLCLWQCKLSHGQRGFCQTHVNRHGILYNLSYGIISAIDIGPIEAKPVKHFQPNTNIMSLGSYGCNFRCSGCHNLEISWGTQALDELARGETTAAFAAPEKIIEIALKNQVSGIAFTYSEPAVWLEYVINTARLAKQANLYTVYVSNSFITQQALSLLAGHIDVLCSDIKSLSDDFYQKICPVAKVDQILDSIKFADSLGIHVETRTNIIPTLNDNMDEIQRIASWIKDNLGELSPWHITRFFPAYKLSHLPATPIKTLHDAHAIAINSGLTNAYVYDDTGCDCAQENLPVSAYFDNTNIHQEKKCPSACCGEKGILLKKYE